MLLFKMSYNLSNLPKHGSLMIPRWWSGKRHVLSTSKLSFLVLMRMVWEQCPKKSLKDSWRSSKSMN